jgi:hypothetical protein
MTIAQTIIAQLGGFGRLNAMIGANGFIDTKNGVSFQFKGCRKFNVAQIKLNGRDLYDVKLLRVTRACDIKNEVEHNDIYAEQLRSLIERQTGLYLTL